jgi:cobalt-zinc-cadmium resistance protein CzcA
MGVELTDFFITLNPRDQWPAARKQRIRELEAGMDRRGEDARKARKLVDELRERTAETQADLRVLIDRKVRDLPGQRLAFSQPIEMRINEMISGVRSDLGIKLFGDDFDTLVKKAQEIEAILNKIDGKDDVSVEQVTGQPILQIRIKQDKLGQYGLTARAVLDFVESIGSKPLGEVVEGQLRFPLVVRLPEKWRSSPDAIKAMLIASPTEGQIPLERVAEVKTIDGPSTITREWGQRRIVITANVRDRDMGSFVAEARKRITKKVTLPSSRYHIEWGGQFENYERARERLMIVVPLAGILVFTLLYLTYNNVVDSLRVFTGVPFGWVGGVIALWLRDMPFSISAAVGFIALSGVAVLDDMILVSYVRQLRRKGLSVDAAVRQAAITRLRPVLMTTLVASFGFLPMAFSTGQGAEVQRPLATVVIGGVIGAMVMSLLVLRVLYLAFDAMAEGIVRLLVRFGYNREQLVWLVGETHLQPADEAEVNGEVGNKRVEAGSRGEPVGTSTEASV